MIPKSDLSVEVNCYTTWKGSMAQLYSWFIIYIPLQILGGWRAERHHDAHGIRSLPSSGFDGTFWSQSDLGSQRTLGDRWEILDLQRRVRWNGALEILLQRKMEDFFVGGGWWALFCGSELLV